MVQDAAVQSRRLPISLYLRGAISLVDPAVGHVTSALLLPFRPLLIDRPLGGWIQHWMA